MTLVVEFTIEPFVGGEPGPHVQAAVEAAGRSGLDVDFGPFGTTVSGEDGAVLGAVDAILRAAIAAGATRVSLQLARPD
ncbi:MAG TPA: thiamine-binding protein [Acidimicrobiales bacterium]|nr:thiamine-binding protein [Acidimicrobiales bacterium]